MGTKIKMDIKQLMCRLTEEELEQESKHLTGLLTEKMPGHYRTEGTDAAVYFKKLFELGIKEG